MRHRAIQLVLVLGSMVFRSSLLLADVKVTEPTGGQNISADKAMNSTNGPAFVSLGNIVLTELAATDFMPGTNLKLILSAPSGWRFNAGVGSVTFQGSRDITAASISVTSSNLTVTLSVGGIVKSDILTISGLQVQPLDGSLNPNPGYILNLSANPGTETIAGIVPDSTTFGFLNTVSGAPKALRIVTQPSPTATAGVIFATQPDVMTYDQFGNQCNLDTVTVVKASRLAGTGTLQGTTNFTAVLGEAAFTDLSHNV